ncbi:hypothetical protein K2O51_30970 (plasmid) [Cupriavidus pinatubonensis]|uniref:hypothetical protein n=1 Tax=Cupriavidus pinatubonensis TaxID=248026 RepID=UPI001C72A7B1|nr:hypothetical protein [Cupriavidus pinatubonensis]QYY33672.1 hypothetical protein K2O51_30970 [Cupriavidus pinatubonensis]
MSTIAKTVDPKEHLEVTASMALHAGIHWANLPQAARIALMEHANGTDGMAALAADWAEEFLTSEAGSDSDTFRPAMLAFTEQKMTALRSAALS